MPFEKASQTQAYAKIGIYGEEGSGKTYTAMVLARGVVAFLGGKAKKRVHMIDTEVGSDHIAHHFEKAGIEFFASKTRALKTLIKDTQDSVGVADVLIVDSMTHFWEKLVEDYLEAKAARTGKKQKTMQFQDWAIVKPEWREFNNLFLNSHIHVIACGRLGYVYEYQTSETDGKKELITTDTKMKAEYFGYEPSLSIEMDRVPDRGSDKAVINRATVIKDRFDVLNGKTFDFPTFDNFVPFFELLNIGGEHQGVNVEDSSADLFEEDQENAAYWAEKKAEQLRDEVVTQMEAVAPGQSEKAKTGRGDIFEILTEAITGEAWRSKARLASVKFDHLKKMVAVLKEIRALQNEDPPPVPVEDYGGLAVLALDNINAIEMANEKQKAKKKKTK